MRWAANAVISRRRRARDRCTVRRRVDTSRRRRPKLTRRSAVPSPGESNHSCEWQRSSRTSSRQLITPHLGSSPGTRRRIRDGVTISSGPSASADGPRYVCEHVHFSYCQLWAALLRLRPSSARRCVTARGQIDDAGRLLAGPERHVNDPREETPPAPAFVSPHPTSGAARDQAPATAECTRAQAEDLKNAMRRRREQN